MAMGVFEGHMTKMADGFKAIRMAELELSGGYDPVEHGAELTQFDWRQFSDEEWNLCPPVVALGGDGAMYKAVEGAEDSEALAIEDLKRVNAGASVSTSRTPSWSRTR